MKFLLIFISLILNFAAVFGQDSKGFVTIQGRVTDYDNNPLDSVSVAWRAPNFSEIYSTTTDKDGYYSATIRKGRYYAMTALNISTYIATGSALPEDELRLEFWAWNFIADRDTTFNMQYHRFEVYGVNAFQIQGATPGYTIYCRPMSLTRYLAYKENKTANAALAPDPDKLDVQVFINDEEVAVRMMQKVVEYFGEGETGDSYLLFVDRPKKPTALPYHILRIRMTDLENGDKGEAVYFLEKKEYITE